MSFVLLNCACMSAVTAHKNTCTRVYCFKQVYEIFAVCNLLSLITFLIIIFCLVSTLTCIVLCFHCRHSVVVIVI